MNYSESDFKNKEKLRDVILDLYSRDIAEASVHFSSRNYAFCFSQGCFPAAIRVGIGGQKTRASVMSELMFVDYIKMDVPTVSEPVPSKNNNVVEEVDIDGEHYCITLFRKANGDVLPEQYWNNTYFENVGRILGKIHKASHEAGQLGFKFKRPIWDEVLPEDFYAFEKDIGKEACEACIEIVKKIKAMTPSQESFGMIHGDYGTSNIFSEWDNVWVFDFDDCCYGYYMYDIASAICGLNSSNYVSRFTRKQDMTDKDGLLAHFRNGYEQEHTLPDEQWALINDFAALRLTEALIIIATTPAFAPPVRKKYLAFQADNVIHRADIFAYNDAISPRPTR